MKKSSKSLLVLFLAAILILSFSACSFPNKTSQQSDVNIDDQQTSEENIGLWESATYLEDTEVGQGSKEMVVEVKAGEKSVKITVHTEETTVGAALLANNLIAGDAGQYGLYIKEVNGITADYDVDQTYWAFYIDGEYAVSGVDSTDITEGAVYQLEYTK